MNQIQDWKNKPFWIRLLHWEYWSFHTVYLPVYPIFIFLCLRARSFFFFAAANPSIKNGGFLGESKKDIYSLVPPELQPKTIFFSKDSQPPLVLDQLIRAGIRFPMIGKPDIGARGRAVKKLENAEELFIYVRSSPVDFHIQEYISYAKEAGIFYYRIPGQDKGNISGIVEKEFLKVRGDGLRNIRDLLKTNPRAVLQIPRLEFTEQTMLNRIPVKGEECIVVPYGNHSRGALFLDGSLSVNERLVKTIDGVCRQIPLFYFGRMDIRYESRELLEAGKSFSILEVNGAGSEPTHMYDPRHSIFFAWREIVRHWILLFKISRANHRLGYSYLTVREGLQMFRKDKSDSKILAGMQNKSF